MNTYFLSRRQFNALCAAVGLSLPSVDGMGALSGASVLAADSRPRTVKLRNGAVVPAIGQGTWHLGQGRHPAALEEEALRTGISLGMTLIDTSGNYGDGRSEELISHVIAGQRARVFLVSKVEANEVPGDRMARACEASLRRLGTDYLDLYLLHSSSATTPCAKPGRRVMRHNPAAGAVVIMAHAPSKCTAWLRPSAS